MALTPQAVLGEWILDVLADTTWGQANRADVLDAIERRYGGRLTLDDLNPPPTRPQEARWRNRASFERANMVRMGLLSARSDGIWELARRVIRADDATAEGMPTDEVEVAEFRRNIEAGKYSVPDRHVRTKTRGNAQRAFADAVKQNYGYRCAITGVSTRDFLVASHIVPWSEDESIRIDPANGICLSTLVDRAFDTGYLLIGADLRVSVAARRLDADPALRALLIPLSGTGLRTPSSGPPRPDYLARRADLYRR